jgi:ketosteroid isomerase-like protein
MRQCTAFGLAVAAAASLACGARSSVPDVRGVHDAIASSRSATNNGDTSAFFGLLENDFEFFPPGAEPLRGDAARAILRDLFSQSSLSLEPYTNEEIQVDGDLAVQRYSFRLTLTPRAGGAPTTETGSGLHVWRRGSDGKWRLWKDI